MTHSSKIKTIALTLLIVIGATVSSEAGNDRIAILDLVHQGAAELVLDGGEIVGNVLRRGWDALRIVTLW